MRLIIKPGQLYVHANGLISELSSEPSYIGTRVRLRTINATDTDVEELDGTWNYHKSNGEFCGGGPGHPMHVVRVIKP